MVRAELYDLFDARLRRGVDGSECTTVDIVEDYGGTVVRTLVAESDIVDM